MTKEEILRIVEQQLSYMKVKYGLQSIALFGSFAKGDARADSDIDFLVELETPLAKNYFGLLTFLEQQFTKPIGLIRKGAHTNSTFLSSIKDDLIYAG